MNITDCITKKPGTQWKIGWISTAFPALPALVGEIFRPALLWLGAVLRLLVFPQILQGNPGGLNDKSGKTDIGASDSFFDLLNNVVGKANGFLCRVWYVIYKVMQFVI